MRNEKPINSVWSRFIMNSLSVGVRSVFSPVNCLSKLLTSLRCFYNINIFSYLRISNTAMQTILTIFGLNGGCTSRFSIFAQSMRLKKTWPRISSSPLGPPPNLFIGFLVKNYSFKNINIIKLFLFSHIQIAIVLPLCIFL